MKSSNEHTSAIHNWAGQVEHGLALDIGDSVEILEECEQWYRGTCSRRPRSIGIFPKTYIHLKDVSKIDPVVAECTQVLREWSEISKRVFVKHVNLVGLPMQTFFVKTETFPLAGLFTFRKGIKLNCSQFIPTKKGPRQLPAQPDTHIDAVAIQPPKRTIECNTDAGPNVGATTESHVDHRRLQ